MTRGRVALRGVAVVAVATVVVTPVSADAPNVGNDRQYDLFLGGDRTIRDRFTGLSWERPTAPYTPAMTYTEAVAWCNGGVGGTRLPTLKELLTIVDEDPHLEYEDEAETLRWIDRAAFFRTPPDPFWTSSPKSASEYWTVNFGDGTTASARRGNGTPGDGDRRRVRCVRFVP